ncbi:MAG: ABC transporter permease [Bacteroidales bacterium]
MFFGKLIPYFILSSVLVVFVFMVLYPIFGIHIEGSLLSVFFFVEIFVLASFSLGMMLSSIFKKDVMALDFAFFYNSPAFIFSGFTFPIYGMPFFDQIYAYLIPYTHFLDGFFKLSQMGLPFSASLPEVRGLLIFVLVGFVGTIIPLYIRTRKALRGISMEGGMQS